MAGEWHWCPIRRASLCDICVEPAKNADSQGQISVCVCVVSNFWKYEMPLHIILSLGLRKIPTGNCQHKMSACCPSTNETGLYLQPHSLAVAQAKVVSADRFPCSSCSMLSQPCAFDDHFPNNSLIVSNLFGTCSPLVTSQRPSTGPVLSTTKQT